MLGRDMPKQSSLEFVVLIGVVSLFADMTYEGAHGSIGPLLEDLGVGLCDIDQPLFDNSIKPSAEVTSPIGYVRLHGRNYGNWFRDDADVVEREVRLADLGPQVDVDLAQPGAHGGQIEADNTSAFNCRYVGGEELPRDPVGHGVLQDSTTVPDASRITPPRLVPGFDPNAIDPVTGLDACPITRKSDNNLTGTIGNGGCKLDLATSNGNITITRE